MADLLWVLVLAPPLMAVATVIAWRLAWPQRPRIAHVCFGIGLVVLGLGVLGIVSGLVNTMAAVAAAGLSAADKQRLLSNGIAEAIYNGAFALVVGLPPTVVGALLRRA